MKSKAARALLKIAALVEKNPDIALVLHCMVKERKEASDIVSALKTAADVHDVTC